MKIIDSSLNFIDLKRNLNKTKKGFDNPNF